MRKLATGIAMVAVAAVAGACADPLTVNNSNNPDVKKTLSTPADVERLISTGYQQVFNSIHRNDISPQINAMSLESYGTVANFGMALRAAIPRLPISNQRGNQTFDVDFYDFQQLSKLTRTMANGITALDNLKKAGGTLGSATQDARARAWGFLDLAIAHGNLALVYDSAAIVPPGTPSSVITPLSGYSDVMKAALAYLDTAIAIANTANSSGFTSSWINGETIDQPTFIKIARSYKARFSAGVARTPAERDAADWSAIIDDATHGITSDLNVALSNSAGWSNTVLTNAYRYQGWSNMSPMYLGMADTSGAYAAWLATPMSSRTAFMVRTPDARWPSGNTRAAQQTVSDTLPHGNLYFRNRPTGEDTPGDPWGSFQYDHYRWRTITLDNPDNSGNWPDMTKAEIDLLAAEGYIRKGDIASAAKLIDNTRVANGKLPALSGAVTSASQPVPGGTSCVPQVPDATGQNPTCGTIMEAMKYEKRVETLFSGYGQWFMDERGWGDLVQGTPVQFPVPYQEMDARFHPFYDSNAMSGPQAAAKGTYGF